VPIADEIKASSNNILIEQINKKDSGKLELTSVVRMIRSGELNLVFIMDHFGNEKISMT